MRLLALLAFAAAAALAADNVLTADERKAGWVLLFDGRTMQGWRDPAQENPPGDSWTIEDGCLKTRPKPRITEDLVSAASYGDFELTFDWRLSPGGNSGVKYHIQKLIFLDNSKVKPGRFESMVAGELSNPVSDRAGLAPAATAQEYSIAFEMQLLDDERHPDAKNGPKYRTGALYGMVAPAATAANPPGEWNTGRILVKGGHVEHWINGVKVLDASLSDPGVGEGATKRWGQYPEVLKMFTDPKPSGPISLQHHGDQVWFRNLKIRGL
ncbi:MAG: DUF1080 domain-containing protein [Bryobacteraceae bacterium]